MTLGEKVKSLRSVEGELRGLGREMSQQDVVAAITRETGGAFSQSYLSQIESGARPHLSNRTRLLLARFFKVHPGYLVTDPPGFHTELTSDLRIIDGQLEAWLQKGAEQVSADPALYDALRRVARHDDPRKCLVLLGAIVDTPHLVDRLADALTPAEAAVPSVSPDAGGDGVWLQ
jgi:transcriptional regulator with XRE-family HTH domain